MVQWLYARIVFIPTLLWNMLLGRWLKLRDWYSFVDDHVIVGAFPFPGDVQGLSELGVKAVVNTCEEYNGPVNLYQHYGIDQFRIPTIDFTHPSFEDVVRAVEYVDRHVANGDTVYIHCKAGRGRSATVAICWMMKARQISKEQAQRILLEKRPHINSRLTQRPVVAKYEREFVDLDRAQ